MNKKNRLLISQGILTTFIIVAFGLIIVNEKSDNLFKNKADKAITSYIETNYQDLLSNITLEETNLKNNVYIKKVKSKQNSNHYFYVKYDKKNITDTYKKDYEEGQSILSYINKKLEKEITEKTNITCTVSPTTSLDQYSNAVKEKIMKEDNLLGLKFYYIQKELLIKDWNKQEITNQIKTIMKRMKENNINPKYYEFTITNQNEITTAIKISNITEDFLENNEAEKIIDDILNNKEIKNSKITYNYQN